MTRPVWVLAAMAAVIGTSVALLAVDLPWLVPAPEIVLFLILAVAASPSLVPAIRTGGGWWAAPVATYVLMLVSMTAVYSIIAPSGHVLGRVLAEQSVLRGYPPEVTDNCRYCLRWVGESGPRAGLTIPADDPQRVCRDVIAGLTRDGWCVEDGGVGCGTSLTRPAGFGVTYVLVLLPIDVADTNRVVWVEVFAERRPAGLVGTVGDLPR